MMVSADDHYADDLRASVLFWWKSGRILSRCVYWDDGARLASRGKIEFLYIDHVNRFLSLNADVFDEILCKVEQKIVSEKENMEGL